MKAKIKYRIVPELPSRLKTLNRLAFNLCFSWKSDIQVLFKRMDPGQWDACGHNPVLMLGLISQERLDELAHDQGFLAQLERVGEDVERYLSQPRIQSIEYCEGVPFKVAYFSAEFGLAGCLPIYSGGLGILAGDHLKSASDLNVPLVGIGLLYQDGYFSQYLSLDGWQMETYPVNDFSSMPLTLMKNDDGQPLTISVTLKEQSVDILIWHISVGRVSLYMLDSNTDSNPPEFRKITGQLYGGDRELRLRQEIILGIGGIRALKVLNIEPTVIHMNEGHSAFSALERINILRKENGLSFDEAREIVMATTVFTTHTPVPAGNDTFEPQLVQTYFEEYAKELGINFKVLLGYGRLNPQDSAESFGMTTLALRLSAHTNGVSRLHGKVSQNMWQKVWRRHPVEDVPIDYITNGIHVPTWISKEMEALFYRYLGPDWSEDPDNKKVWDHIEQIPNTELWRTHERCREHLIGFTRRHLVSQLKNRGASIREIQVASEILTPDAMTIGFARRFATYKRATLLFRDPDRLERILNHPKYPVQIIIAGKAHPQDNEGKAFIRDIIHFTRERQLQGRIVFLEDYNFPIGQALVSGTDIWLNTPRRPLEACGTSGMKALANGSLNLSVLDGWWDEGYHSDFGWAIGHGEIYNDHEAQDNIESHELYNLLEERVIPLFYQHGHDGIPQGWVEKMKAGLKHLVPIFNAHRMVQEYVNLYYQPCSKRYNSLCHNNFSGAKDLSIWRQKLMTNWHKLVVLEVTSDDVRDKPVGETFKIETKIKMETLVPEDLTVEAYYGRLDQHGDFVERTTKTLQLVENNNGVYTFKGDIPCHNTGNSGLTVRIMPSHERLENHFVMGLVTWA